MDPVLQTREGRLSHTHSSRATAGCWTTQRWHWGSDDGVDGTRLWGSHRPRHSCPSLMLSSLSPGMGRDDPALCLPHREHLWSLPGWGAQSPPPLEACCAHEAPQHCTCHGHPQPMALYLLWAPPVLRVPTGERRQLDRDSYTGQGPYDTATQDGDHIAQLHRIGMIWHSHIG